MSLINQVLKDIDQRGGNDSASSPLDGNVKSVGERVPAATSRRLPMLVGALVLVAGAAGGWWWWRLGAEVATPATSVTAAVASPTPVSTPSVDPASSPSAAVPVAQSPVEQTATSPAATPSSSASPAAALATQALVGLAADWAKTLAGPEAAGEPPSAPVTTPRRTPPLSNSEVKKTVSAAQASDSLSLRAERAFRERRPAEGQRLLRDALARNPKNHMAREWLATVLIELGRPAEAETWLAEGVLLAPDRRGFVVPLALLRQQSGNEAGALQLLESSIHALGDDAEAHAFLAALLQRQGRHVEATKHYVTALRQYPANARWLVGLGLSLQAQGMRQAAIEAFESALATRSLEPGLETLATNQLLSARQGG